MGRPIIPKTSSRKMARYPYWVIHARTCCSMAGSPRLNDQPRDLHRTPVAADHDESALGHVMVNAVAFQVVADDGVFGHPHVLVEHGAADLGAPADIAVVQDHAVVHDGAGMHAHAAAEHGVAHRSAG